MATLVTHNDLDGCVCAILFKAVYPDGKYYIENYDTVDERIKQILEEKPEQLFITDISPSREVAKLLDQDPYCNVLLFDHHKTALHFNDYHWAVVDTGGFCGADLFYSFLADKHRKDLTKLGKYDKLVFHANDYDLWFHRDPHSAVVNSLLNVLGCERFVNRFLQNPSVDLTETEKYILEIEKEKEEKYIQEAVKAANIYGIYAVTFAEKLISEIGHNILHEFSVDVAVIVNAQKGTVSFRSKKSDVSLLAKALGGGGHPNAAGSTIPDHLLYHRIVDLLLAAICNDPNLVNKKRRKFL